MATNAQDSGPLPGQKFSLARWRQIFGAQATIVGDTDGTAFALTLPPSGNDAVLGSATIESIVLVGGHPLIIAAGDTQEITIPASTNPTIGRTDIIAARRDTATFNTPPGPVRLVRIGGTEGSAALPSYSAPLTEALWAVTRKQGQALNQATAVDLRNRSGRSFLVPAGSPMPPSAPLGTRATRDGITYLRAFDGATVDWIQETWPTVVLEGDAATQGPFANWQRQASCEMTRNRDQREAHLVARRSASTVTANGNGGFEPDLRVMQLHPTDRPVHDTPVAAIVKSSSGGNTYHAGAFIGSDGWLTITSTGPNVPLGPAGPNDTVTAHGKWKVG